MILALLLAQAIFTPGPIVTPPPASPSPLSERAAISQGLDEANAKAKSIGGTLGAVVIDLQTGSEADLNADEPFPMQSVQKLPIAVFMYRAIDDGRFKANQLITVTHADLVPYVSPVADAFATRTSYSISELLALMLEQSDNSAANVLLRLLGGADAVNARLRSLDYAGILIAPADAGYAKPATIAAFLSDLQAGKLMTVSSRASLLSLMSKSMTFPGRLRAGFPKGTLVEQKTGTSATTNGVTDATNDAGIVSVNGRTLIVVAMLHGARGSEAARDAVIASVAGAAYDAVRAFPI